MCSFNQCLHEASRSPAITAQSKCVSSSATFYRGLRVARGPGGAVRGTDPFVLEKSAKSEVQSCVQHTLLIFEGRKGGNNLFWSHVKKVDDVRGKRTEKLLKCCSKSRCRRRCDPCPSPMVAAISGGEATGNACRRGLPRWYVHGCVRCSRWHV